MKGWQALSWGGRQDSPSGLTPEKETLGEHPPRSAPGPHDFKVESLFDLHLSPGVGGGARLLTPQVWDCLLPHHPALVNASAWR